ncbi:MAG: glycosyl hydrolase family 10 [Bacteroidales bacterium]|nr:glycosyl hydrolase family 10 [Bacteroidales bacterium]
MKYYTKILFLAAVFTGLVSCAVHEIEEFPVEKPANLEQYEYLNEYDVLKSYVDRTAYPNFKLGAGVTANKFVEHGQEYLMATTNFDEVTPGNAMKHASIVDDNGKMDFSLVKNFVDKALDAGITVYGHTLAWHSQQNLKFLNTQIANKKVETAEQAVPRMKRPAPIYKAPSKKVPLLELDFEDGNVVFNGWGNNSTREVVDGALKLTNPSAVNPWEAQIAYDVAEPFAVQQTYKLKFKVKGSAAGSISAGFQITDGYKSAGEFGSAEFDTTWKTVELSCTTTAEGATRLIFSFGQFAGDIYIDDFEFSIIEAVPVKEILKTDFSDGKMVFNGWGNNSTREIVDGALKLTNPSAVNPWEAQMAYDVAEPFEADKTYYLSFKVKGSSAGSISAGFQITDGYKSAGEFGSAEFDTEWKTVELSCKCNAEGATRLIFSFGQFAGDIYIDDFEFLVEAPKEDESVEVEVDLLNMNFDDGSYLGGWGGTQPVFGNEDGAMKITNPKTGGYWEGQFAKDFAEPFENGTTYKLSYKVKASGTGTLRAGFQITDGYKSAGDFPNTEFGTEWQEVELSCTCNADGATRLVFSFGDFAGDIYIDDLRLWTVKVISSTVPQTPEEKKDTLTKAMDKWIKGMMEATAGKVVSWDAVNEAVSGVDGDGDGYYDLQSVKNVSADDAKNNFYWQDYLGSEDYVRIVVSKARQYFEEFGGNPADLKLFINDYNLESDWDDNKKLKSLIHWIEIWEADGETIIDGIGTQMHISCYENVAVQKSKEDHVVKMLELMVATGKLVKISELDMGYVDADGNTVPASNMTEAQHLKMAEFYKFIVKSYLEIVPPAQQYGITQWCTSDPGGALGSGWRGGEPVGLWDQNYNRKHTYAGFAAGLKGE